MERLRRLLRWTSPRAVPAPASEAEDRRRLFSEAVVAGDAARDRRDWIAAATAYMQALAIDDAPSGIRVQCAHALKEAGKLPEAEVAYRRAAAENPRDGDACLHLADVLKRQNRISEAIDVWLEALRRDPDLAQAREALVAAGARDRVGENVYGRSAVANRLARLAMTLDDTLEAAREAASASAFPLAAWDAFRRQYPVRPAPGSSGPLMVAIDARTAEPSALRTTLLSLIDQRHEAWQAVVLAPQSVRDHPVASLARMDPRIVLTGEDGVATANALAQNPESPVLMVTAGTLLDPEALGWFGFGLARTGAVALYADHDHFEPDWRTGPVFVQPVLQSMADRHDMAGTPHPPSAVLLGPALRPVLTESLRESREGPAVLRRLVLAAIATGPVAHLPRVLTSLPASDDAAPLSGPQPAGPPVLTADARILVIVPTRDEAAMLERCLDTFRATATRAGLLDLRVIDNRSVQPATHDLLTRLKADRQLDVVTADEPFNWARLNNEAAKGQPHDIVVFANNDTEMLTAGWDDRLREWLGQADIGVVGARLLYSDGALQHGGILLGGWQGRPLHDGLGVGRHEGGPAGRWRRSRAVAAVTGAFMACRRETFEALGGFDPRLAIAYNDIDFCLKARAVALSVVYAADIELTHHESRTRGQNDSAEKVAWDDSELADMYRRWDEGFVRDPGYNPQWASAFNRPYDGFREPTHGRIMDHLEASARPRPWAIDPDTANRLTFPRPHAT